MSTSKARGARDVGQLDAAVVQLSRDVVSLHGDVRGLREVVEQATERANGAQAASTRLAEVVTQLRDGGGDAAEEAESGGDQDWPTSWWMVTDPDVAYAMLDALRAWLDLVWVQYDRAPMTACWPWHPAVVAELWSLRDAWYTAHEGPKASAVGRMDWYDRWRPGVERRLKGELSQCSLEKHQPQSSPSLWTPLPAGTAADAFEGIAAWWSATHGAQSPPQPSPDMVAAERGARPISMY